MHGWTKLAATAAVLTIAAGSGAAWAGQSEDPPPTSNTQALGGGVTESKYIPIAPCRVADTRADATAGQPAVGVPEKLNVIGVDADFSDQGGTATGCGIPPGATAIELSITAAKPGGQGYLRAFPVTEPSFGATWLNYNKGVEATNTGTVALCTSDCDSDLKYVLRGSRSDVIVDLQGYYVTPMAALVVNDAIVFGSSSRVTTIEKVADGTYVLDFERNVSKCNYVATSTFPNWTVSVAPAAEPNQVGVKTNNVDGDLEDGNFYVQVTC